MMRPLTTSRLLAAGLPTVLISLALAGCGSSGSSGGSSSGTSAPSGSSGSAIANTASIVGAVKKDDAIASTVPAAIKSAGTLKIGSNVQSPPNNFYAANGKTPVGFEVDIITAIGKKMGVKVAYSDMAFDSLITSLQSGRVDATIAGMNDNKARQQKISFVDYFNSGITLMIQKGNPAGIKNSDDLCGKKIAVVQGTTQEDFAKQQSSKCTSAGKKALSVTATPSDSQNQTQLRTGRVDAILNDLPSAVYISKTAGGGKYFQVVDQAPINGAPYGIGVNKKNQALTGSIDKSLQSIIADGTYTKILKAWNVTSGAVMKATINRG